MRLRTIFIIVSVLLLSISVGAKKTVSKARHSAKSGKVITSQPHDQLMLFSGEPFYGMTYTIGVKDGKIWGCAWEKGTGLIGIGVESLDENKFCFYESAYGFEKITAVVTPKSINCGSFVLKRDYKGKIEIYESGDWVLIVHKEDSMAVVYNSCDSNRYMQLWIQDVNSNGFSFDYYYLFDCGKGRVGEHEFDMPIFVMKQGDTYRLADPSITGSEELFVRVK